MFLFQKQEPLLKHTLWPGVYTSLRFEAVTHTCPYTVTPSDLQESVCFEIKRLFPISVPDRNPQRAERLQSSCRPDLALLSDCLNQPLIHHNLMTDAHLSTIAQRSETTMTKCTKMIRVFPLKHNDVRYFIIILVKFQKIGAKVHLFQ